MNATCAADELAREAMRGHTFAGRCPDETQPDSLDYKGTCPLCTAIIAYRKERA